jgi:F-type H+-transporting ATPase subunit a
VIKSWGYFPEKLILGPIEIRDTVLITWFVMFLLIIFSLLIKRKLSLYQPSRGQLLLEALLEGAEKLCQEILKKDYSKALPFLLTLWLFIGGCNLIGVLPGFYPPTSDINTPLAFAFSAFLMRHLLGMQIKGFKRYLSHFFKPLFLFPLHLLAELTRSFALAIRLFGNILSGEIVALILLGVAGLILPVPFIILHLILGLLQAYIFGILSLAFLSQAIEENTNKEEG